jgi:hypothetical protein
LLVASLSRFEPKQASPPRSPQAVIGGLHDATRSWLTAGTCCKHFDRWGRGETRTVEKRLKVFISYSRKDISFAQRIVVALEAGGLAPKIDTRDFPNSKTGATMMCGKVVSSVGLDGSVWPDAAEPIIVGSVRSRG